MDKFPFAAYFMLMNETQTPPLPQQKPEKNENAWLNILLNVIIPALILTKLSDPKYLGQVWALIVALAFPIIYGAYDYITRKKHNFFSALGLISVLLTGGIGLFQLNKGWMVAKETAIPLLMAIAVYVSQYTKLPLLKTFLNQILDLDKIQQAFEERGESQRFQKVIKNSTLGLTISFFISAALNYILAVKILVGDPGSVEFNESLGKMTALSFPVISLPMMVIVGGIMFYFFKAITMATGKEFEEFIRQK